MWSGRPSTPSRHGRTSGRWVEEVRRKLAAGRDIASELLEGAQLVREAAARASGTAATTLERYVAFIDGATDQASALHIASSPELELLMIETEERADLTTHARTLRVAGAARACPFGSWYEFFPLSQGTEHRSTARSGMRSDACLRSGDGLRRDLPAAHPPHRHHEPQGTKQRTRRRTG